MIKVRLACGKVESFPFPAARESASMEEAGFRYAASIVSRAVNGEVEAVFFYDTPHHLLAVITEAERFLREFGIVAITLES